MKRTKEKLEMLAKTIPEENDQPEILRWRKTGGGTFRMGNGKIIKPNQVFSATVEDIPEGFRHMIVPADGSVDEVDQPLEITQEIYAIRSASPGWYNVVDSQEKVINEKMLRQDAAKELVQSLTA